MKILVIEACGLRADYLGCYGNDWVATPNLDRLAAEGVVFDWHYVDQPDLSMQVPWARRSVSSGCHELLAMRSSIPNPQVIRCEPLRSFAGDVLRALESETRWLWVEGPSLLPPWRLDAELLDVYFDEDDVEEGLSPWANPPLDVVTLDDAGVLRLQNTYASVVTAFDAQLGVLLERLASDVLVCVTSRAGLPLGEHGMIGAPAPRLHDELVHVPLVMRLPGREFAGLRVAALTQPVDLVPTLLDSLGEPAPTVHGSNLWPSVRGDVAQVRPYAVSRMSVGESESFLVRTPQWAFHVSGPPGVRQLYAKPEDRWEVNDLLQQNQELADALERTLRSFMDASKLPTFEYPPVEVTAVH